jgi:hypothetical protein
MSKLNVGDRVEFVENYGSSTVKGDRGTVTERRQSSWSPADSVATVRLDKDGFAVGVFERRLKLIPQSLDKFQVGDRVLYNGQGTKIYPWGDRFIKATRGTVVKVRLDRSTSGARRYNVQFDDNGVSSFMPENHLISAAHVFQNPFAATPEENTMSNLIGPKPEPVKTPLVVLPLHQSGTYLDDAGGNGVLRVVAGSSAVKREELTVEILRLINLGLEADKDQVVAAPKFRLRKSGTWYEVEPGHFVHSYTRRSDAVRDWESHDKSRSYGALLTKAWEDRHPLVEDPDAPEYVLREALDLDRDRWFEVKPGRWAMAETREGAEAVRRDNRTVHGFPFGPLKVNGVAIPEHA